MTKVGLFDGATRVGSVALPDGRMPDVIVRGENAYVYFQGEQLIPGQRPGDMRLELAPGEGARFLKADYTLLDPGQS